MVEWVWIEERDALAVHDRSLLLHGGATGLRELGLLQSALARPLHLAAYDDSADVADLAACYTAGIVQNHPFIDGSKRTGFVVGILFLELNGGRFTASEQLAAEIVIRLASGEITQADYRDLLRENHTRPTSG